MGGRAVDNVAAGLLSLFRKSLTAFLGPHRVQPTDLLLRPLDLIFLTIITKSNSILFLDSRSKFDKKKSPFMLSTLQFNLIYPCI